MLVSPWGGRHGTREGKVLSVIFYGIDIFKNPGNPGHGVTETRAQRDRGREQVKDPLRRLISRLQG